MIDINDIYQVMAVIALNKNISAQNSKKKFS